MRRSALALLGLLALPAAAAAQDRPMLATDPPPERLPESRFAVTPYIGVRVPFNTGDLILFNEDGDFARVETERGGAAMVGLNAEARVHRAVSFIAGAAYSGSEQDVLAVGNGENVVLAETDGPAIWFAKAGVSVRLPDPIPDNRRFHPSAFITVAPSMLWMDWQEVDGGDDDFSGTTSHFALNLAADATARLGRGDWAINLGVEDYMTFWDTDALRRRDTIVGEVIAGEPVTIDYDYSRSNIITLRLGVSYRFGQ